MLRQSDSPIRRACQRRYSAWTLYARTFAGNRTDADDIVRSAVTRTLQFSDDLSSEAQAHDRVLSAIRTEALALLRQRQIQYRSSRQAVEPTSTWSDDVTTAPAEPSVLRLLTEERSKADPRYVSDVAAQMLRELPRGQRRAIEMLLVRRPALPLSDVARRQRADIEAVSEDIEDGLDQLAAALHAAPPSAYEGGHPQLKELSGYVDGALSGDEARSVVEHCHECSECGDRLGTMMLLRSQVAKATLVPRISRGARVAALVVTLAVGLVGGAFLARALAPNPWEEHATVETVPRWYHDFLYGSRTAIGPSDIALAQGLDLLVRGRFEQAIAELEPLAQQSSRQPEASAYLGIALYLTGHVSSRTVDLLEAGTSSGRAGRIADWYLANVLLIRGDVHAARRRLQALAFVGDWVGRQSQALLDRLEAPDPVVIG